ncbi:hypothetical protein [Streptomyces sp. KR55]|uniref:hypothetical protein n=1 Tax=Streptomyces sp. KR55 TaxID=3457425 RepID=UPI003FD21294
MTDLSSASKTVRVLELLAHLDPRLWEIVNPRQPVFSGAVGVRSAEAGGLSLNPQPLPPREAMLFAIRDMSLAAAEATIAASMAGGDPSEILKEVGDDLCPDPPRIPWPKKWPVPVQMQGPFPIDATRVKPVVQATAALVFQTYADRTTDEALSTSFARLADRLLETAVKAAPPPPTP